MTKLGIDFEKSNERREMVLTKIDAADVGAVPNTPEGREALAGSPELSVAYAPKRVGETAGVPLWGFGTSYMYGAGSSGGTSFFDGVAADMAATAVHNNGQGGSTTPALFNQIVDGSPNGAWVPGTSTGVCLLETGIGEALQEDDATWLGHRNVFENKVMTAVRYLRARAVRKFNHATVTRDGGVTLETITGQPAIKLDPGAKMVGNGVGFTITLNEAIDAELVIFTCAWRGTSDASNNGDFRYRVDGGPWRAGSTHGMGDPRPDGSNALLTLSSVRIPDAKKNSVIRIEKVGDSGETWFHSYGLMGNVAPPPIILVQDVALVESAGAWTFPGGGHTPGARRNTATLNVYRGIIERVASSPEFGDGLVTVADPQPRHNAATMLDADGVHLNPTGHTVYRGAINDARQRIVYRG